MKNHSQNNGSNKSGRKASKKSPPSSPRQESFSEASSPAPSPMSNQTSGHASPQVPAASALKPLPMAEKISSSPASLKKLDDIISKRPIPVSRKAPSSDDARQQILEATVEKIKSQGNTAAISQIREYDDKLDKFIQKANQLSNSSASSAANTPTTSRPTTSTFSKQASAATIQAIPPYNPRKHQLELSHSGNSWTDRNKTNVAPESSVRNTSTSNNTSPNRETLAEKSKTSPSSSQEHLEVVDPDDFGLQNTWQVHYDRKGLGGFKNHNANFENNLFPVCRFYAVKQFWRCFNNIKKPSFLEGNSTLHIFKAGIKPMWEDAANADGGKWTLNFQQCPEKLDLTWEQLVLANIGGIFGDANMINGLVVSKRARGDRISVWVRHGKDEKAIAEIGQSLKKLCNDAVPMDYSVHGKF